MLCNNKLVTYILKKKKKKMQMTLSAYTALSREKKSRTISKNHSHPICRRHNPAFLYYFDCCARKKAEMSFRKKIASSPVYCSNDALASIISCSVSR